MVLVCLPHPCKGSLFTPTCGHVLGHEVVVATVLGTEKTYLHGIATSRFQHFMSSSHHLLLKCLLDLVTQLKEHYLVCREALCQQQLHMYLCEHGSLCSVLLLILDLADNRLQRGCIRQWGTMFATQIQFCEILNPLKYHTVRICS